MKRVLFLILSILLLIGLACNLAQVATPAEESTPASISPSASPPEHTSVPTSQPTLPPGKVYYISPDGDDANPGTQDQPWRTIQKAATTLVAGETVYLRAGTYTEQVVPQNDGSQEKPITYAAYPGETVTIVGSGVTVPEYSGLIDLTGRSYINIQGLRVIHSNQAGIYLDGSSHIRIEGNYTYDTHSSGIGVWSSRNVIVAGNEVVLACNDGAQEDITIGGTDTFEVFGNHVHDGGPGTNGGEGICIKDGSSNGKVYFNHVHHLTRLGIYLDAWDKHTHNIEVFDNIVHDTQNDGITLASEMGGLLEHIRIYNNISYNNRFLGINCSQNGDSTTHPMRDILIVNNTVVGNGTGEWGGGISIDSREVEQVIVRNNIVSGNLSFQMVIGPGVPQEQVIFDHNLVNGFRGYEGETHGTEVVEGDPRFADPAAADFHLQADSPAIDRGAAEGAPMRDMDDDLRPQDGDGDGMPAVDIGADEVASVGGTLQPKINLCADPEPPLVTDLEVYQPPSLEEPPARLPFRDPVFGRCLVRVTDRKTDIPSGGLKNEYSRVQSFNADGTRLLVLSTQGVWVLYDAASLKPIRPLAFDIDPRWSATDPHLVYYSSGTQLMAYHTETQETMLVHDFAGDFAGQTLTAVWTRYEGSPSRDGRIWGLMAEDADWLTSALLIYDLEQDRVTAVLDTRAWQEDTREIDSVTISPLGNYFLAYLDKYCEPGSLGSEANPCGLMVYDRGLRNGRGLLRLIGHSDTALDINGREVLVYQDIDTDHISMLELESGVITPLWEIDFSYTSIGLHFSGRAFDRPGWVVVSTHDGDAASHTWMDDQIFLIELKAGGRVVRLAHTHSLVDENQEHDYWAEPQASANLDLTRILFTTNWNRSGTEEVEMYLIVLPTDWEGSLP